MEEEFEVSFNSPQCGWMSIGLKGKFGEFRTTTAYAPHTNALGELMDALAAMASSEQGEFSHILKWNRDPEEYDFVLRRDDGTAVSEADIDALLAAAGEIESISLFGTNVDRAAADRLAARWPNCEFDC